MPKEKGKGKGKGKGKEKGKKKPHPGVADGLVKKLFKTYERNCNLSHSVMAPNIRKALKTAIEDEKVVSKFILEPIMLEKEGDLPVLFEPLLMSIRQERYLCIKDLFVWDYPLTFENMASFALFVDKPFYKLRQVEFMDCLLEPIAVQRLARSLKFCDQMTILNLDYNEFGDEGCKYLCEGLRNNVSLLSLSLCYCDLGVASGSHLGQIISTTAVQEVYLDGNNLQSEGTMELVKLCMDQANYEAFKRAEDARLKAEEELKAKEAKENRYHSGTGTDKSADESRPSSSMKKKKKKGKKKKKEPPGPPPVGPWIHKLHVADNGIDGMGKGGSFAPIICMRLFKKLLSNSRCLEELDLEDNLIGEVGGREILDGLALRKEQKEMGGVKVRTTHRMTTDTFNSIVKLGSGLKKKKKGKKGKKKKK